MYMTSLSGRIFLAVSLGLFFSALLLLAFPELRPGAWPLLAGIPALLVLFQWLLIRFSGKPAVVATNDNALKPVYAELQNSIQSVLTVERLLEQLDDFFHNNLPVCNIRYFLSTEFLQNKVSGGGLYAWGDAEPWISSRLWQLFTTDARVIERPSSDQRLEEIFEQTGTGVAVPLVHRSHLLGVILFGCKDEKRAAKHKPDLLRFLDDYLPTVLDRIRIYGNVWQSKELAHSERLLAMRNLSASIAHEMRTPLSGIRASITGVENYLPLLLKAYDSVHEAKESFPAIRPTHRENLQGTPARVSLMIDQANAVIDLLLMNLREDADATLERCHAGACVRSAVERYPFKPVERERVKLDIKHDFDFMGVEILFIYVIFNLLKNALYAIRSAQKGEITILLVRGTLHNTVVIEDTGTGIPQSVLDSIFDSFFTTKEEGTGAGLTFCRRTLEQFGGSIECDSELGSYTRFTLRLPKVEQTEVISEALHSQVADPADGH